MATRIQVDTREITDDSLTTDLNDLPVFTDSPVSPRRDTGIGGTPTLRLDPLGSGFDIYVSRDLLNQNTPRAPSEIPDNLSGVNRTIPYWFGRYRQPAYPFKDTRDNGEALPRFGMLYHVAARSWNQDAISEYEKLFIDGIEINTTTWNAGQWYPIGLSTNSTAMIFHGDGSQNVATSTGMTTDALSDYAIVAIRVDSQAVSRAPRVEVLAKGQHIMDYTLATPAVGYTDNFGNILVHWIEEVEGLNVLAADREAIADACAEDPGDGSERRVGGFVASTRQDTRITREVLRAHAACSIIDAGTIFILPDRPATSVIDVGELEIIEDKIQIEGPELDQMPEDVEVLYMDLDTGTIQSERATDTLGLLPSQVRMTGITSGAQARREAIERYNRLTTEGDRLTLTCKADVLPLLPGDVWTATSAAVDLTGKLYRLMELSSPEPGLYTLKAREYQPIYSDNILENPPIGDTASDNPNAPPAVTGLTITPENVVGIDGSVIVQLKVAWAAATFAFVDLYMLEIWNNDVSPVTLEQTRNVAADATEAIFTGLNGDTEYEVKIRIKSTIGTLGAFTNGFETTYHADLLAQYDFDDADPYGDTLGAHFDMELKGTSASVTGKVGDARELVVDGNNNVSIGTATASSIFGSTGDEDHSIVTNTPPPFTYVGWFRLTTAPTGADTSYLMGRWYLDGGTTIRNVWLLHVFSSGNSLFLSTREPDGTDNINDTTHDLTLNTWHFFAVQYVAGYYRVFFDDAVPVVFQDSIEPAERDSWFCVGAPDTLSNVAGTIEVDRVRVYRAALTPNEIEKIRAAEV